MTYPQIPNKQLFSSMFSPQMAFEYYSQHGWVPEGEIPKRVIFCFQSYFMEKIMTNFEGRCGSGIFKNLYWIKNYPGIAVAYFGTGAPKVVLKMELLIAWGVKEFISIGTAGAISSDLKVGDLVGCDRAIRDEGTSHHYLPVGKYSYPTDGGAFASQFKIIGTTWTLDAYFRQTWDEIKEYQKENVLTIEMEASALFAVAQVREVSIGSGFVISDLLHSEEWAPSMCTELVLQGLNALLTLALK